MFSDLLHVYVEHFLQQITYFTWTQAPSYLFKNYSSPPPPNGGLLISLPPLGHCHLWSDPQMSLGAGCLFGKPSNIFSPNRTDKQYFHTQTRSVFWILYGLTQHTVILGCFSTQCTLHLHSLWTVHQHTTGIVSTQGQHFLNAWLTEVFVFLRGVDGKEEIKIKLDVTL